MPKALTREQMQAQTRELIIAAAERVFLTRGYNATTIAQIAAEAGRTHGSIYGHFAGKEDLCLQLLRNHFERVLLELSTAVRGAAGPEAKLAVTQEQWGTLLAHSAWITLAADFVLATRNDPVQHQVHRDTIDAFTAGVRMLILAQAATLDVAVEDDDLLERAATALLATGVGLAVEHALGAIDLDRATATFIDSVELWFRRLDPSP